MQLRGVTVCWKQLFLFTPSLFFLIPLHLPRHRPRPLPHRLLTSSLTQEQLTSTGGVWSACDQFSQLPQGQLTLIDLGPDLFLESDPCTLVLYFRVTAEVLVLFFGSSSITVDLQVVMMCWKPQHCFFSLYVWKQAVSLSTVHKDRMSPPWVR